MPRIALALFRNEVPGISASRDAPAASPKVTKSPSYWECTDGETILTVDLRGNASYRKAPGWVPDPPADGGAPGAPGGSDPDAAGLIQRTRRLAASWLPAERLGLLKPAVKRETLLLAKLPGGAVSEVRGRTIVRLIEQDAIGFGFFQAVFDPEGALLRVDLALEDAPTRVYCDLAVLGPPARRRASGEKPLNLGCFFDPGEYRFELTALSVEGEPFLDLYQEMNPFERGDFDPKALGRVSVPDYLRVYRGSQEYRWWCWTWWERYGRVGAFRGNWLERNGRVGWEHPPPRRPLHRSLGAYGFVEGEPRQTTVIPQPDGPVRYPFAISRHFDPSFYRDLEQCHVAFLFTYGRTFEGVFEVRRGLEVLVVLLPPSRKLGVENLRHLFLDGCGAFTFRRGNAALQAHLVKTWIEQAPVDGVRTVCSSDGLASGVDRSGWRYFGYYNKGESISDSWAFAVLDEYVENCPVTAAFGSTTREALGSLLTGRFTDQKAEAKAVAISLWASSAVP